jgi:acyl-coenzyme A thioesterase PaaI-like protein
VDARLNDETTYQLCFACGQRNDFGLKLRFDQSGDRIHARFVAREEHQGFPGVVHGGIIVSLLDETMSRTGALRRLWLMTGRLEVRFKRPGPIGEPIDVYGEIVRERSQAIDARGWLALSDGSVVAEARGVFIKLPEDVAGLALQRYPEFANFWSSPAR